VRSVATARGGQVVAAVDAFFGPPPPGQQFGLPDGEFAIWRDGRLVGGKPRNLHNFGDAVALSPDGSTAAVSADSPDPDLPDQVLIVDTSTGSIERRINVPNASGSVTALAFSPDGTLASGTWSGIVNLWNPKTGQAIGHRTLVAPAPVASIAFSPDGTTFATSGGSSGGTRIWGTATQRQLGSDFPGGDGQWGNVAYTPDARYLISVFGDDTAYRWPATLLAWDRQHRQSVVGVEGREIFVSRPLDVEVVTEQLAQVVEVTAIHRGANTAVIVRLSNTGVPSSFPTSSTSAARRSISSRPRS